MPKRRRQQEPAGRPLRVGFVPLCDCAPLVMAQELGLFARHGVAVELSREVGWATIRDKILFGELDAAHATAAMVFAATLGLGSIRVECLTGLVFNLHGNAITLSDRLWDAGVRDGATLRQFIRATRTETPLTLGVVFRYSSHDYLLRKWLRAHKIDPERDVRIVVVPPPQMPGNLKAGNLDGYCVGEPWNSVAVAQRAGWVVATSGEIAPLHPEKVLMVRRGFAESCAEAHLRLIAALWEACVFCDQPENRERVAEVLARPNYVNTSAAALRMSLCGPMDLGRGRAEAVPHFHIFAHYNANEPTPERAELVLNSLREAGALPQGQAVPDSTGAACFRADLFRKAVQIHQPNAGQPSRDSSTLFEFSQ